MSCPATTSTSATPRVVFYRSRRIRSPTSLASCANVQVVIGAASCEKLCGSQTKRGRAVGAPESKEDFTSGKFSATNVSSSSDLTAESRRLHRLPRDVGCRGNALHSQFEFVGVGGVLKSGVVGNQVGLEQIPERLIEGLHAVLRGAGRDGVANGARFFGHQDALANVGRCNH